MAFQNTLNAKIGLIILPKAVIVTTNVAHSVSHVNLQTWAGHVPTNSQVLCLLKVNGIGD